CDSNSEGAAPNWVIVTEMIGRSTLGRRVIGSLLKPTQPRNMMTIAPTMEGRGCLIDHAEIFNAITSPLGARAANPFVAASSPALAIAPCGPTHGPSALFSTQSTAKMRMAASADVMRAYAQRLSRPPERDGAG